LTGRLNRSGKARFADIPVYFPVTREFVAETGSTLTASATTHSEAYFEDEPCRRAAAKLLTKDEARGLRRVRALAFPAGEIVLFIPWRVGAEEFGALAPAMSV
jgi:hypothetical protein